MKRFLPALAAALLLAGCAPSVVDAEPEPARTAATVPASPLPPTESSYTLPPVTITDAQRATLDTTFGVGSPLEQQFRDDYCPMDASGREYYAELVAQQLDGYTTEMVLLYMTEWCGS